MIAFRHADPRFPFLCEDTSQPAGRWNAAGELTHCFCNTPDGAWAEFLRHEEINDPGDILTICRALWAVDIKEPPALHPDLPPETLTGNSHTWSACQELAQQYRHYTDGIATPSAALLSSGARGWRGVSGLQPGPPRDGKVFALIWPATGPCWLGSHYRGTSRFRSACESAPLPAIAAPLGRSVAIRASMACASRPVERARLTATASRVVSAASPGRADMDPSDRKRHRVRAICVHVRTHGRQTLFSRYPPSMRFAVLAIPRDDA